MKHMLITILTGFALSVTVHADLGLEFQMPILAGINKPAARKTLTQVQQPEAVVQVTPPGFASPVTQAATVQDAINSASSSLTRTGTDQAAWIEAGGQLGVVASGSAHWNTSTTNPQLRLHEQRLAWMDAALKAKTAMSRFLKGASVAGHHRLVEEVRTRDSATLSGIEADREQTQQTTSATSAVLRGAVIYELVENAQAGEVTVTLVSTPASQGLLQARSSGVIGAGDLEHAMSVVMAEVQAGVVPPTGGRLIENPADGSQVWIAFAAEPVSITNLGPLRTAAIDNARRIAGLRAEHAMVSLLRGEAIAEEDLLDTRYEQHLAQTDDLLVNTSDTQSTALHEQATSSTREAVASGHLPAGVHSIGLESRDGTWQYRILSWSPQTLRINSGKTVPPAVIMNNPIQPGEPMQLVEVHGRGPTRMMAIKNALLSALMQVNGAMVEGSSTVKTRYEDAIKEFNGRVDRQTASSSITSEDISVTSGGLIRRYTVIAQGPLPVTERVGGDSFTVHLQVDVPIFNPDDPRPGEKPTIAVLPMRAASVSTPADMPRLSAPQVVAMLEDDFNKQLVTDGGFRVLDVRNARILDAARQDVIDRVERGQSPVQELARIGHELTADYLLIGTLHKLSHQKWRHYVKVRDAFETAEEVFIELDVRLVNVATCEVVWTDHFDRGWRTIELAQRRGDARSMSPAAFAIDQATAAIQKSLGAYLGLKRKG